MSDQEQNRNSEFRLNAKNIYLTFPTCDVTATVAMASLMRMMQDKIKYAIISTELHEDGTPHLHLLIQMIDKCNIRRADYLDTITGKHGNYQVFFNLISCFKCFDLKAG